jgi:hypothetical protein
VEDLTLSTDILYQSYDRGRQSGKKVQSKLVFLPSHLISTQLKSIHLNSIHLISTHLIVLYANVLCMNTQL